MTSRDSASSEITPEVLLRAYACGIFPMAESADDPTLFWVEPELRGVIPFDGFRVASRLARTVRSDAFTVTVDTAFKAVIAGCAAPQPGRDDTWINKRIRDLYLGLFTSGHCHSVEVWQDDNLVGGLYGVSLGRAFFGESMFHTVRDASKVALVHLVARLIAGGFELLDTQYVTEHLKTFGAVEISRRRYRALLDKAIAGAPAEFLKLDATQPVKGADALAIIAALLAVGLAWPFRRAGVPAGGRWLLLLGALLGAVAAFGLARSGHLFVRAVIGMALGFAYFVFDNAALAMGNFGAYPPFLAAWAPFVLFLLLL